MRTKDILIGLIVLAVLVGGVLWYRKARIEKQELAIESPTIEEQIGETFNGLEIPKDAEKAELKDVSGGDGFGIATRDTILADLPDLEAGSYYQAWTEKNGSLIFLGTMRIAKGGFLLEGGVSGEKVIVSKERVLDGKIETKILEGSF